MDEAMIKNELRMSRNGLRNGENGDGESSGEGDDGREIAMSAKLNEMKIAARKIVQDKFKQVAKKQTGKVVARGAAWIAGSIAAFVGPEILLMLFVLLILALLANMTVLKGGTVPEKMLEKAKGTELTPS